MIRLNTLSTLFICLLASGVFAQNYQYLGTFSSNGVPNYLLNPDTVPQSLINDIDASLPEGYPVPTYNPQYIDTSISTDIQLTDSAAVWVTFVHEGAGYKNVLGYYTYDLNAPPASAPNDTDITIVFPNVSFLNSGGGLKTGDKVKIGNFSANTGIGWVLLANGYQNNAVTNGNWKLYSNPDFNPESNPSLRYHNVLLKDTVNDLIVLGFEDIRRDYGSCDNDFNDAIFYIRANPFTAIKTDNFNNITKAGQGVSSGNNGGLESNGAMASAIAKRQFHRLQQSVETNFPPFTDAYKTARYSPTMRGKSLSGTEVLSVLPSDGWDNYSAVVTSPEDLIAITNAEEVFAADYIQNYQTEISVLATRTKDEVYDHTKAICDRLLSGKLLDVAVYTLGEYKLVLATIQRADGTLEYAIPFSIDENQGELSLQSQWNTEAYQTAEQFMNFQIWADEPHKVKKLALEILDGLSVNQAIKQAEIPKVPEVFMQSGYYRNGKIIATLINRNGSQSLELKGSSSVTETQNRADFTQSIQLTGAKIQQIEIRTGEGFDFGFSLVNENNPVADVVYLADGPWGLDFSNGTTVNSYFVNQTQNDFDKGFALEREVETSFTTNEYFSIFRSLKPGNLPVNISDYHSLNGTISFEGQVTVAFVTADNSKWAELPKVKLDCDGETEMKINIDNILTALEKEQLCAISFSVSGNGEAQSMKVAGVNFGEQSIVETELAQTTKGLYPNPASNSFQLVKSGNATVSIYNAFGKEVLSGEYLSNEKIDVSNLRSGVYIVNYGSKENSTSEKLIIK